jgi:hypothetical protein
LLIDEFNAERLQSAVIMEKFIILADCQTTGEPILIAGKVSLRRACLPGRQAAGKR